MNLKRPAFTSVVFCLLCAAGIGAIFLLHFIGRWFDPFFAAPPETALMWAADVLVGLLAIMTSAGVLVIWLGSSITHKIGCNIWNAAELVSNRIAPRG